MTKFSNHHFAYRKELLGCIFILLILRIVFVNRGVWCELTSISAHHPYIHKSSALSEVLNILSDEPLSTKLLANQLNRILDSSIDDDWPTVKLRCHRYGTTPLVGGQRRRIFVGSLLADESWLTILNSAIEAYGIYYYFVFVESNQTQNSSPRKLRFQNNSPFHQLLTGGIFGPQTVVQVKQHIWETFNFSDHDHLKLSNDYPLMREFAQRERILEFWIENGMSQNDIGIIADADETFSRDFLLAAQSCDFPELRPDTDCAKSRISARAMSFRGDFSCMFRSVWFKPQMLIGHCFEGIGNSSGIPLYPRNPRFNDRSRGYGWDDDFSKIPQGPFPLYKVQDLVRPGGTTYHPYNDSENPIGYHLSNFFNSPEVYRFKFGTYGHPNASAFNVSFEKLNVHVEYMLDCARNIPGRSHHSISPEYVFAPASFVDTDFITARKQEILAFVDNRP